MNNRLEHFFSMQNPMEKMIIPENASVEKLDREYVEAFPQQNFGELSVAHVDTSKIQKPFGNKLEAGFKAGSKTTGDDFLHAYLSKKGLENVYIVKAPEGSELAKKEPKNWEHHQPESLRNYRRKLEKLQNKIANDYSKVDPLFKQEYNRSIGTQIDFCTNAEQIGTPQYTVGQQKQSRWREIIDFEESAKANGIELTHENLAIEFLEKTKSLDTQDTQIFSSIDQAFDYLQITPEERESILGEEKRGKKLKPEQGKRFFEILLKRLSLDSFKVVFSDGTNALTVSSESHEIKFPKNRSLTPDEMVILAAHEIGTHAVSGENGYNQPCPLSGRGVSDYLSTQEGLATIAEMIAGAPFGHPRQRLFAARYIATALSLKTKQIDGEMRPQYTLQEIYNILREYKIDQKDAAETIWRMTRGTSLTRQIVDIPLTDNQVLPVPETFTKDLVYFEGFVKVRDFFMQSLPLRTSEINDDGLASIHGKKMEDFSSRLLARIGRASVTGMAEPINTKNNVSPSYEMMHRVYDFYVSQGREALLDMMQYFVAGKYRFEDMLPGAEWEKFIKHDQMIKFKDLFKS
jgi:hypothetical protein